MLRWIFLFLLIFLAGCISTGDFSKEVVGSGYRNLVNPEFLEQIDGSCSCVVCSNNEDIFYVRTNLVGSNCYVDPNCNISTALDYINEEKTPDLTIRQFMLGQGSTISEFAEATPYCAYSLSMSVQWLVGSTLEPYTLPEIDRATCLLSADVIPVYVLYSEGKNIDLERAREIGKKLGQEGDESILGAFTSDTVGPNIVFAEVEFNEENAFEVAQQIEAIDEGCGNDRTKEEGLNCWVGVAPKFGDLVALEKVMSLVGDKVDVIGIGVRGENLNLCSGEVINSARVIEEVLNYSKSLDRYGKPKLIYYVLFDRGSTSKDGCLISEGDVVSLYNEFWPFGPTQFRKNGIIGMAPYLFNSTSQSPLINPLGCVDCAVGKGRRLDAWYGWCGSTSTYKKDNELLSTAGEPLIFSNNSLISCDFGTNLGFLASKNLFSEDKSILQPQTPKAERYGEVILSCAACSIYDESFELRDFSPYLSRKVGEYYSSSSDQCTAFEDEISRWASVYDLDPMLLRAFVSVESGFNQCAAAKVCRPGYDAPDCYPTSACYSRAYDYIEDPSGLCTFDNSPPSDNPDWRWCGFGLTQSLEPPYNFWPERIVSQIEDDPTLSYGVYSDIYDRSGFATERNMDSRILRVAEQCGPDFNPFDPEDSLCAGGIVLRNSLEDARAIVSEAHNFRNGLPWSKLEREKDELFAIYIASWMYAGHWYRDGPDSLCRGGEKLGDCFVRLFSERHIYTPEYCRTYTTDVGPPPGCADENTPRYCYGIQDPVLFFKQCVQPKVLDLNRRFSDTLNPAEKRLVRYIKMQNCKSNLCPPDEKMKEVLCEPDPETGEYNRLLCDGPGVPKEDVGY